MPDVQEVELTLYELQEIMKSRPVSIEIESPDGFVPVTEFLHHGWRPCLALRLSNQQKLECSLDHRIEIEGPDSVVNRDLVTQEQDLYWIEAQHLRIGDFVVSSCQHPVEVLETTLSGTKEVFDLTIDHHASNGHHRFYADGVSVHNCVNCGICNTVQEVKSITTSPYKETGATDMHKLLAVQRDSEVFQKLLVEIRINPGPTSAIQPRWLRFAITRALLKASDGELVEPNIQERFSHSRQHYRIHQDSFKSLLSGSFIAEFCFNSQVNIDEDYVKRLRDRVNDFVPEGWSVVTIARKSKDFVLKNSMQYALTTYRFDSRRVNGVDLAVLQRQINLFFNTSAVLTYKSQQIAGRDTTRVVAKDFDKAKVLAMSAGIGRNRYETVLKTVSKVEENHPLIFVSGLLGTSQEGKGKTKSYVALYGTEISIDGFYQYSSTHQGSNLFDLLEDTSQHSTACPRCGDPKLINIMTGLPYGEAPYEQDSIILSKYGKVCQSCFCELSS